MKYLINPDNRVMMKGVYVKASNDAGDFVYDTEEDTLKAPKMKDIAKINKLKLKGKKIAEIKESFDEGLGGLKVAEKNEPSLSEKIRKMVKTGNNEGKTDDEILIEIVQSGVKFQKAGRMMQQAMIDLGLMLSQKERYKQASKIMDDKDFEPDNYDDVRKMAKKIAEDVTATSEIQAIAQIKKYCKENEIEMPRKPATPKTPLTISAILWIAQNLDEGADNFEEWLEEKTSSEKTVENWVKKFKAVKKAAKEAKNSN